ncbi:hypothetical protein A3B45_02685 [Candidatus Daviesbacteria bacterium RIFCSPLOWO2_01_FULL_39_12]|uniref:Uncharacterized protein n=1 Tax=Candidatus Daviesbacteria bacterium RIFCSPLOWO2_01_FULL_39_12 TaxID=1797785 RepID=A0A1F5KTG1_9BACT|nr:MAG: hypothetical protein A3B45_02685 [Candidatus Daviesbacteria bacterium RIFCSPLOWO2_01_FULL_39_12]
MKTTQEHIPIAAVKNDICLLKKGGAALILQVPAVNFGLLSEREQAGIIFSFAQLINSLSSTIQICIYSERLNISSYLELLDKARASQTNPLLLKMMGSYRSFIQSTIKENEVLDKKFYLVIPLFSEEVGLKYSEELFWHKVKTVLLPRREQIIRLLGRIGLRAQQLDNQKIIELFYNIYNRENFSQPTQSAPTALKAESAPPLPPPPPPQSPPVISKAPPAQPAVAIATNKAQNHPFVVEELL